MSESEYISKSMFIIVREFTVGDVVRDLYMTTFLYWGRRLITTDTTPLSVRLMSCYHDRCHFHTLCSLPS